MLSSNTLLKNDRYSIIGTISTGPAGTIYLANDSMQKASIALIEHRDSGADPALARVQHDGLLRLRDDFEERSCRYSASEPLATDESAPPANLDEADLLFDDLKSVLIALSSLKHETACFLDIGMGTLLRAADGRLKFVYFDMPADVNRSADATAPHAALERVWDSLDHITQKAIYSLFDENSLALLESPPDMATEIYSLGAVFYQLATGLPPGTAVERAIEMLDSDADPLISPNALNSCISVERSDFLVRMLEIKRERRFATFDDAIFSLPPSGSVTDPASPSVAVDHDEGLLLEIPHPSVALAVASSEPRSPAFVLENVSAERRQVFELLVTKDSPDAKRARPVTEVAARPRAQRETVAFAGFESLAAQPKRSFPAKFLAMAAVALIASGGIGWVFLGNSLREQSLEPPASVVAAPVVPDRQGDSPTIDMQPTVDETKPDVLQDTAGAAPAQELKPRPQVAETKPNNRTKEARPGTRSETKSPKKLTVDDLIN